MTSTDLLFAKTYNQKILSGLTKRFGPFREHQAELHVTTETMLTMVLKMKKKNNRRGEVVMVVPNKAGEIWLHTKLSYPKNTYRLMTGGLNPGELPQAALYREVEEETGFKVEIDRCLAVITYRLFGNGVTLPFVSYLFLTTSVRGYPHPVDTSENIEGFTAVRSKQLPGVAKQLRSLPERYVDWGIFRAISHEVTAEELK